MIRNISKTLKLIKYAHNLYIYLILMVFFLLLGIALLALDPTEIATFIAFIILAFLAPAQCIYDFLFSGFIKSSPLSRSMELGICNLYNGFVALLSYVLVIIYSIHKFSPSLDDISEYTSNIFYSGLAVAVVLIYFSVCFKSFIISTLGFFIGYMAVNLNSNINIFTYPTSLTLQQSTLWGVFFVLLGIAISSILRVLVYKKPISSKAVGSSLRKHMQ